MNVIPILAVHLVLTALPGVAAALAAARAGERRAPVLLAIGLAATGVVALVSWWAYYADPQIGECASWLVLFGSLLLIGVSLRAGRPDAALLRALATPLVLWMLGSAFLVFFGFLYGGTDYALTTATTRFSGALPSDNRIPFYFAEWFYTYGHHEPAPVFPPEWLSSDRPPLEQGYVVSQRAFGWAKPELHFQVLGVVLQQLWIVGLWALLLAARVGRLTRALAMLTVLLSSLVLVNGFFVWPKLLPAAMLLAAAALIATPLWPRLRHDPRTGALIGLLLALTLLGHGSSVFAVIALAVLAALRGGLPGWRWLTVAVLAGALLFVPWVGYQRLADPPGDRLTKWMLGGAVEVDDRSAPQAILDGYREVGLGGAIDNKAQNFVTMAGGGPAFDLAREAVEAGFDGDGEHMVRQTRAVFFLYLLPSVGLLLIALPAMAIGRKRARGSPREWSFALTCLAIVAIGCLIWGLLIFGSAPARTTIHVGSYLIPILALAGAAVGLRAAFPRFAVWYLGANVLLMLALYVPSLDPPLPGMGFSPLAAVLAALGLVGFVALVFSAPRRDGTSPESHRDRVLIGCGPDDGPASI